MNRKGFTLIELLAVIVILAIIALIATPVILNIINSARANAKQRSAELVYTGVQYAYVSAMYGGIEGTYVPNPSLKDIKQYLNVDNVDKENKVTFDNDDAPEMLKIETNDGAYCEVTINNGLQVACYSSTEKENAKHYFTKYVQTDSEAADVNPVSFETDDWATIQKAVQSGTYPYQVGDTKTVTLSDFGTFTLRIANTTTPSVCNNPGFSLTACGFVIEFADIITEHEMYPYTTNVGGWNGSELRTYLTSTIYDALPQELKDVIIDTYVVSGHGKDDNDNQNYVLEKEKLYLLSPHEVWENVEGGGAINVNYDTAWDDTRQLDYYAQKGVTTNNYSTAIKEYKGTPVVVWLRSAYSYDADTFYLVNGNGSWHFSCAYNTCGVAPAFRIG